MNYTEREIRLLLAGLLHDIGKFYQRADNKLFDGNEKNQNNEIGDVSFKLAQDMCPSNAHGGFGYHHVVWTSQFFENPKIAEIIKAVKGLNECIYAGERQDDNVVNLACNHHRPKTELQAFIQLADWWSAGMDRTQLNTFEKETDEKRVDWGRDFHKKRPLASIFESILSLDEKKYNAETSCAFPLKPLALNESIFPSPVETVHHGLTQEKYRIHWEAFLAEFEKLPTDSFENFFGSLLHLLRKYTWCVPSNTNNMSDVSLYDHLRMTSALAHCLFRHREAHPDCWSTTSMNDNQKRIAPLPDNFPVLLVCGDLSGIQDFIYNISSSKAAQSLKGRSFYLQLFMDTLLLRIMKHDYIRASSAHVVYASGGKFYMLLPNTDDVKAALQQIHAEAEMELWENHHGRLGILIEWIPFVYLTQASGESEGNILYEGGGSEATNLGALWRALGDKIQQAKPRLFSTVIAKNAQLLFDENNEVLHYHPDDEVCGVTGLMLRKKEAVKISKDEDEEFDVVVEKPVAMQIDIGKALKDAKYLLTFFSSKTGSHYLNNKHLPSITILSTKHYLVGPTDLDAENADAITSSDHCLITSINDTDFLKTIPGQNVQYGFRFYGGNEQAASQNRAKTFNELTRYNEKKESESYLGVLRMDVDGLGELFIKRIPAEKRNFSTYATLSAMLDWFFSGYLNRLRTNDSYKDHVNIIYSGGDDLFIVGRWDKTIEIARDIREKFRLFVRRNDISISGGLAIVHNKFPIRKAADLADEAEKIAKKFMHSPSSTNNAKNPQIQKESKNAFTVFNLSLGWGEEFEYVEQWKQKFVKALSQEGSPRGLLHRIMSYYKRKKAAESSINPDYSYKWQAAYSLKRLETKYENNEQIKSLVKELIRELFASKARNYDLLGLAARWAELELRFSQTKNK